MELLMDGLLETLSYFEDQVDMFKVQLEDSPEGRLIFQKDVGGRNQFIKLVNEDGKRRRFGLNRNEREIRALAKKEFATKALEILEPNVNALREAVAKQRPFDPDEILRSMNRAYTMLPEDYFFDRNELMINLKLEGDLQARINRHAEWGMQPYDECWYHPENKTKRTSNGRYVRSKAELLIFESLLNMGIPNHYDEEGIISGIWVVPDFTFRSGKMTPFYWDHFGMMDDPGYAKRNYKKLGDYYDAGLIPGDNLILTFSRGDDINMGTIKSIIINEVLPRL